MKKTLRILITNDDGIHAPGLKILENIARKLSEDVWVVAPEMEQSGAGHSLTINAPLRYQKLGPQRFSVNGTPTDCVLLAVRKIIPEPVDLVLSGVNRGKNVGEDVTHSGTIAGAMEGTLFDIPSIAFSQNMDYGVDNATVHWETAEAHAPAVIAKLLKEKWGHDTFFNVNFPDCTTDEVKGIKLVPHGKRDIPKQLTGYVDPKGRPYFWLNWAEEAANPRRPDSDIKWLFEKYITVTPISLDLTNYELMKRLKAGIEQ